MPRKKTEPAPEDEATTSEELAELDAKPETNEGNESAMAGREATAKDRKGLED